MSRKYFLVEVINNDINNIIKQPLKQTHRIKYTCFDVSSIYLIFGTSSGGLYVFKRNPCEFCKLIPTKEGAISFIAISPNEKVIAAGTEKGTIIVIESCFNDSNYKYQVYNEHKGCTITALIWNFNDLYCGDSFGKVSAISHIGSLTNTIFHNPITILMHLDSTIIQLDVYYKFLLASTKSKTFLCDTYFEQYRQIGKKVRNGEFGACFYSDKPSQKVILKSKDKSIFKILKDDEYFDAKEEIDGVKIYCTRPGMRIWEADFNASVILTHQFKTSLNEMKTEVITLSSNSDANLKINVIGDIHSVVNFSKIFVANNFFITFIPNLLMVFDNDLKLLFKYKSIIKDVKIVKNYIYLWNTKEIKIICLMDIDMLVAEVLNNKQYDMCAQICLKYNKELENLKTSLLGILKEKLQDDKMLSLLEPFFEKLKKPQSNSNGIVTVDNGYACEGSSSYEHAVTSEYNNTENVDQIKPNETPQPDGITDHNYVTNIIFRQYQVNKMNENLKIPQFKELLNSNSLDNIVVLMKDFETYLCKLEPNDNNVSEWCYKQFIIHLNEKNRLQGLDKDSVAYKYVLDNFIEYNKISSHTLCICGFPLPLAKNNLPKFYDVGCEISKLYSNIYKSVPYMYKNYIESNFTKTMNLSLLMQFSDIDLINQFSKNFTYDLWDESVKQLIKLKQGNCLNCDKNIQCEAAHTVSWNELALSMIKSIGGVNTIELLRKYSKFIDNVELGMQFYQTCIFSEIVGDHDKATSFLQNINGNLDQFEFSLKAYLINKHTGNLKGKDIVKGNHKCSKCDLLFNSTILEYSTLVCGHKYHNICLNDHVCSICDI